jgi:hypothetical protein
MPIDTTPIRVPLNLVPQRAQALVSPEQPESRRLIVAKAALPFPAEELVICLAYLVGDASERVVSQAIKGLRSMPKGIFSSSALSKLPPSVLDTLVRYIEDTDVLMRLVINDFTPSQSLAYLASTTGNQGVLEAIGHNQNRMATTPDLVEAIFFNPNTPMTIAQGVIEFAVRQRLPISHFPGYRQMVENILGKEFIVEPIEPLPEQDDLDLEETLSLPSDMESDDEPGQSDDFLEEDTDSFDVGDEDEVTDEFDNLDDFDEDTFTNESTKANDEQLSALSDQLLELDGEEEEEEEELEEAVDQGPLGKSIYAKISEMAVSERIRLALTGNHTVRQILVADHYSNVALSVLANPGLTMKEVARYAQDKTLADDVVRRIAKNRRWIQAYSVKLGLCYNPKTPLPLAMSFLKYLTKRDLKSVALSREVSRPVAKMAKQHLSKQK